MYDNMSDSDLVQAIDPYCKFDDHILKKLIVKKIRTHKEALQLCDIKQLWKDNQPFSTADMKNLHNALLTEVLFLLF